MPRGGIPSFCLVCPRRTTRSFPLATSHNRTVPSALPEASVLPSGENATAKTKPLYPALYPPRAAHSLPVVMSHSLTSPRR